MNDNLTAVRAKNMRILTARFGTARQLHEVGLKSYWPYDKVNRMASGQSITDAEARAIESMIDLPSEWMDVPHMDVNLSMEEYNLIIASRTLGQGSTEFLQSVIVVFKNQMAMMQKLNGLNESPHH